MQGYTLFFLFLLKNRDCRYSLEPPRWGGSNEYPQSILWAEIWKISEFFIWKFSFFVVKFSVYWNRRVFVMARESWIQSKLMRNKLKVISDSTTGKVMGLKWSEFCSRSLFLLESLCVFLNVYLFPLTHCILKRLPHTAYWKSLFSIVGMLGYEIEIFQEKNGWTFCKQWRPWSDAAFCGVWSGSALFANYTFTGLQTTMGYRILRRLIWVCTVCQLPFYGSPDYNGLNNVFILFIL